MEEKEIKEKFTNIDFDKTCAIQVKIKNSLVKKDSPSALRRMILAGGVSAAILIAAIISHKVYLKPQAHGTEVKNPTYREMLAYKNINKYPYYKLLGEEK